MKVLDNLKPNEKRAIEELQQRFEKVLPPNVNEDGTLFYRFLKARDFDLDKAEVFLRKHLDWRKAFQLDTILTTFQPKEVFLKYAGTCFVAYDKDGDIVNYDAVGKKDPKDMSRSVKMNDLIKYCVWQIEKYLLQLKNENEKTGRKGFQMTTIFDLDAATLANVTNKGGAELFIRIIGFFQDNYPERMKSIYVINAPAYYTIFFSIIKRFLSHAMTQKIRVFGHNGWKEALLEMVDKEELPAFLGGNKTDPDGNPLCKSFIHHGGTISPNYFLSPEDRYFKDKNRVKKVLVPKSENIKVFVEVEKCNSLIHWEFETKNKDIGFGLFFQQSEEELEEMLPIQRFVTSDGTETGSFRSLSVGTYVIVFDNSHSWLNSKEVYYCITVQAPV